MQYFLGPQWTDELAADWAAAYALVAKVMVQAAEEAEADGPAWWIADVLGVERRTMDVGIVQIRPHAQFDYLPGQSFAMEIPHRPRMWRYYSPANAPRADGTIELHIQLVPGGLVSTSMLRSLRAGDTVRMGAPVGDQLVHTDDGSQGILMVAGGTGLAPLRAILEQIDRGWEASGQAPHVQLFHGIRVQWSLYEHQRLTALAQRPWFDYTPVVSDDTSYSGTHGLVGTVAAHSAQREGRRAMVCGSEVMVQHTVGELTKAGTTRDDIRFDEFVKAGLGS